jgi:peroxiredoxin
MQNRREIAQKQRSQQTFILAVIGAGLVLVAFAAVLALPKAQEQVAAGGVSAIPVEVSFAAPEVQLTDLDNHAVSLADYHGQVILYNAWATWCPPCKEEMPTLQAYYEEYKKSGFVIVAIEDGEPVEDVRAFVQQYGLTFPVWPDPKWKATTAFRTENLPTSFVIDRTGTVRLTWTGAISRETLEKYVTPLLKE